MGKCKHLKGIGYLYKAGFLGCCNGSVLVSDLRTCGFCRKTPHRSRHSARSSRSSRQQRQPLHLQRRDEGSLIPLCALRSSCKSPLQPSSRRLPAGHIQSSARRCSRVGCHSRVGRHRGLRPHESATELWLLPRHPRRLVADAAARPGVTLRTPAHDWSRRALPHPSHRLPTGTVGQSDLRHHFARRRHSAAQLTGAPRMDQQQQVASSLPGWQPPLEHS